MRTLQAQEVQIQAEAAEDGRRDAGRTTSRIFTGEAEVGFPLKPHRLLLSVSGFLFPPPGSSSHFLSAVLTGRAWHFSNYYPSHAFRRSSCHSILLNSPHIGDLRAGRRPVGVLQLFTRRQ